jgi:hypothetical protein
MLGLAKRTKAKILIALTSEVRRAIELGLKIDVQDQHSGHCQHMLGLAKRTKAKILIASTSEVRRARIGG